LQRHFLDRYSALYKKAITGFTRRAQTRLAAHNWPGNIRELENVISGACIMAAGPMLDLSDLPELFRTASYSTAAAATTPAAGDEPEMATLEEVQRRHLLRVLDRVNGNKAKAAEILGVGRNTLYQMLNRIRSEYPNSDTRMSEGA